MARHEKRETCQLWPLLDTYLIPSYLERRNLAHKVGSQLKRISKWETRRLKKVVYFYSNQYFPGSKMASLSDKCLNEC